MRCTGVTESLVFLSYIYIYKPLSYTSHTLLLCDLHTHTHSHACTHIHVYTHNTHVHHTHTHTRMHVHTYMYTHTIHMYITHTHTHWAWATDIQTDLLSQKWKNKRCISRRSVTTASSVVIPVMVSQPSPDTGWWIMWNSATGKHWQSSPSSSVGGGWHRSLCYEIEVHHTRLFSWTHSLLNTDASYSQC